MMIFFMNDQGQVYARYGGRDARDPDNRQSLRGLLYTMRSVADMHQQPAREFAPRAAAGTKFARGNFGFGGGRCMHCHQVKEKFDQDLKNAGQWTEAAIWRFPLPDNLGLVLDVDRGNVIKSIQPGSPAAAAGLQHGDRLRRLNQVPIHSFADAQFALDKSPLTGAITVAWLRGAEEHQAALALAEGWRKTDISWRPSLRRLVPTLRLAGVDLAPEEKKALGLPPNHLAFRQKQELSLQAKTAGIQAGDIILGLADRPLEMDLFGFIYYVQSNYLSGQRIQISLLRDGKKMTVPLTLTR